MTENQKNLKIAFTKFFAYRDKELEGYKEQVVWSGDGSYRDENNLIVNTPRQLKLKYYGYTRGRSSLNIQWIDHLSKTIYYSSMGLLDTLLKKESVIKGEIEGEFIFKKQGTSILLELHN